MISSINNTSYGALRVKMVPILFLW